MDTLKLSNALFTKTQQRVLGLLYGAPAQSFYTNEIVRIAAVGRGTVTRELVKLTAAGVLTVSAARNQKHYQANPDCPVYTELTKIARKLLEVEIPKSGSKLKAKTKPVKAKSKPVQKPVRKVVKKPQKPKPITVKEAAKMEDRPKINITIDDEGQMGFF